MTRKKKKPTRRKSPVRLRLTNVRHGTEQSERLYANAETRSVLGKRQLAAGTWQHPRTELWQVWISLYGSDVTWISAHRDAGRAKQDMEEIQAAARRGDLEDSDKVAAMAKRLAAAGDAEPEDMDVGEIAQITASIQNMALEASRGQSEPLQSEEELTLVMAELVLGKISVGWRLGHSDMIDVFAEDLSPQDAARLAADITQGRIDLEELSHRPMREVYFPINQTEAQSKVSEYKYTLPEDDEEVIVSGIAMAILDIAKQPPLQDAHAIQERALWHCEQSRKHCRVPLTNDYEGFKQLFISSYTGIYQRNPHELGKTRDIINRHPIDVALVEIRNIVKGLYFPDIADLERLAMEYENVLMTPHRSLDGYYVTFVWKQAVQRTPDLPTPMVALEQAQRMIDRIKAT